MLAPVGKLTCIIIYISIVVGVIMILNTVGGMDVLRSELPPEHFKLSAMPLSTILGWFATIFVAFLTMQAGVQPVLAAKDHKSAIIGVIVGGFLTLPIGVLTAITGMAGKISFADIASADAFAVTTVEFVTPWITGIIFGAVGLVITTTLAGQVLALGTIIRNVLDNTYKRKGYDERQILKVSRIATFIFALLQSFLLSSRTSTIITVSCYTVACAQGQCSSIVGGLF